jgi:Uma2 family endonuclease
MRAVMVEVPQHWLDERRRTGADRRDEVWEGVLHMSPLARNPHQQLIAQLSAWLVKQLGWRQGYVIAEVNVACPGLADWRHDYRVPDAIIASRGRFAEIDRDSHCAGGPEVVIEVASPGDETYDKLGFYFEIGVLEVWIIDRDSKEPEVYRRGETGFESATARAAGWLGSEAVGVRLRGEDGKLAIQLDDDATTKMALPS